MGGAWDTAMMMRLPWRVLRKRWGTQSTGSTRTWNEPWSRSFNCNMSFLLIAANILGFLLLSRTCIFSWFGVSRCFLVVLLYIYFSTGWFSWMPESVIELASSYITSIRVYVTNGLYVSVQSMNLGWFKLRDQKSVFEWIWSKIILKLWWKLSWDVGKFRSQSCVTAGRNFS